MRPLAGRTIKSKLIAFTMFSSCSALLFLALVLLIFEFVVYRKNLFESVSTLSRIVSFSSPAAIVFNDRKALTETVSALKADRSFRYACIYGAGDMGLLASYAVKGSPACDPTPGADGRRVSGDTLAFTAPVLLDGNRVGSVHLAFTLDPLYAWLRVSVSAVAIGTLAAAMIAFSLASQLHPLVTRSMRNLAETAREVSRRKDFTIRAAQAGEEEIATLVDSFNDMLGQIQSRDAALRQAIRSREDFLAVAAHELRTPLTPLRLQIQLISRMAAKRLQEEKSKEEASLVNLLRSSDQHIERLSRLIDDMLDISRLTSGRPSLHMERFDLAGLVQEMAEYLAPDAASTGCELVIRPSLPVPGEWDRLRIEQVLINLVSNAIKYGRGKPVEVSVHPMEGDQVRVVVQDHGIGVAPEDRERIFERFERAVSLESYRGLGLGLFIVREIVHAHHGTIEVESEVGKGSRFTVILPRHPRPAAKAA